MSEVAVTKKEPALWDYSPFSLMRRFSDELDRFFGNGPFATLGESAAWMPAIEVAEKNGMLTVRAELPGMKKEDIKVEATANALVIEGERKHEKEEKKEGYFRSERSYGKFYRAIPLPEGATLDKAKAEYNNGVLEVSLPIPQAKVERKQIPVQTRVS